MKMEKYLEPQYINRFLWMFFAIIVMGIGLSFMFIANMGTDPFSTMNRGIAMAASDLLRKLSVTLQYFLLCSGSYLSARSDRTGNRCKHAADRIHC